MAVPEGPSLRALRCAGRVLLRVPRVVAALLAAGWMALIWNLSDGGPLMIPQGPFMALVMNLAHAPMFGLLALIWLLVVLDRPQGGELPRLRPASFLAVLALVFAYAVVDEWHQVGIPGRTGSPRDVLTDVVGGFCVLWVVGEVVWSHASEGRVRWRLFWGVSACVAAAAQATWL